MKRRLEETEADRTGLFRRRAFLLVGLHFVNIQFVVLGQQSYYID